MNPLKYCLAFVMVSLMACELQGQELFKLIQKENLDLDSVKQVAKNYFDKVGRGKGSGYKIYKRWEAQAETRVMADGRIYRVKAQVTGKGNTKKGQGMDMKMYGGDRDNSDWVELGPTFQSSVRGPKVGRVTAMAVEPRQRQLIYAGSPGGGLWKTTDGGANWRPLGDNFSDMKIWSIAIDPKDTDTVYYGNSSGEVFKSTDGGSSFVKIEDQGGGRISTILIHPERTNEIYLGNRDGVGIYRSVDGGRSWFHYHPNGMVEIEDIVFKPGDPNTIYAAGNQFYKSTDGGESFELVKDFGMSLYYGRRKLAVSPANPEYIYVLLASGKTFFRLYRSTDGGGHWYPMKTFFGQQMFAREVQAYRDMAITVSDTDVDEVHIGGVVLYRSMDGGRSFEMEANSYGKPSVHSDIEVLQYMDGTMYIGSDGGISKSNDGGRTFVDISRGMGIQQFYDIAASDYITNHMVGGAQDNGISRYTGNKDDWSGLSSGDGVSVAIAGGADNRNRVFFSTQNGELSTQIKTPENGNGNWVTPVAIDPNDGNRFYAGYGNLYRHDNKGQTGDWVNASPSNDFGAKLSHIEVCPSNSNTMYVATRKKVFRSLTVNSSAPTWEDITPSGLGGNINDLAVDPFDDGRVALVTSGGQLVTSLDHGRAWSWNAKPGLPNGPPLKSIVMDRSVDKGVYVAVDGAIYYGNDPNASWTMFSNNLPNVAITDLELSYIEEGQEIIRAATYGRGAWESHLEDARQDGAKVVGNFPYVEGFEHGLGIWTPSHVSDGKPWEIGTGSTPNPGMGPTAASDGTYYAYADGDIAVYNASQAYRRLESKPFDLSGSNRPEISFNYHMKGGDPIQNLTLKVTGPDGDWRTVWAREGDQGDGWKKAVVDLTGYRHGSLRFQFVVRAGNGPRSDIAIDEIRVEDSFNCHRVVSEYPYYLNRSGGPFTNVRQDHRTDDADWLFSEDETPTEGTGPDYNTSRYASPGYMYFDASAPNHPNKSAIFETDCLDLVGLSSPYVYFPYHMYGGDMGSLELQASVDGRSWKTLWSRSGDQGDRWHVANVDLSEYRRQTVKLRFKAVSGNGEKGDIAISFVRVYDSIQQQPCSSVMDTFPVTESFEGESMDWVPSPDYGWSVTSGATPNTGTGPELDPRTGSYASEGSKYSYLNSFASDYPYNYSLKSKGCFDLRGLTAPVIKFDYNMNGTDVEDLSLQARPKNVDGNPIKIWRKQGDQGNGWKTATVDLGDFAFGPVELSFLGKGGKGPKGNIALDNIRIGDANSIRMLEDPGVDSPTVFSHYVSPSGYLRISWDPPELTGNAGEGRRVAKYKVYRNGQYYRTVFGNYVYYKPPVYKSNVDRTYGFQVKAFDDQGNASEMSDVHNVDYRFWQKGYSFQNFESGNGGWTTGSHARIRYSSYARGRNGIVLWNNKGYRSAAWSPKLNMGGSNKVKISFSFRAYNMYLGNSFVLEMYSPYSNRWIRLRKFTRSNYRGTFNFRNYYRYNVHLVFMMSNRGHYQNGSRIRFRSLGSNNYTRVIIDDVSILHGLYTAETTQGGGTSGKDALYAKDDGQQLDDGVEKELGDLEFAEMEISEEAGEREGELKLSPNPADGNLYVQLLFEAESYGFDYVIRNINGAVVKTGRTTGQATHLDISGLSSGVYILEVGPNILHLNRKFIKK